MAYVPDVPLWCWMVAGPDAVYLSQPTIAWCAGEMVSLGDRPSCVARCQHTTQYILEDTPRRLTSPVQCGGAAGLDLQGRFFCWYHMHCQWECYNCHTSLEHGEGGFCSVACREAIAAAGDY